MTERTISIVTRYLRGWEAQYWCTVLGHGRGTREAAKRSDQADVCTRTAKGDADNVVLELLAEPRKNGKVGSLGRDVELRGEREPSHVLSLKQPETLLEALPTDVRIFP